MARDYYSVLPLSRRWAAPLRCSFSRLELDAVAEHKAAREAMKVSEKKVARCSLVLVCMRTQCVPSVATRVVAKIYNESPLTCDNIKLN